MKHRAYFFIVFFALFLGSCHAGDSFHSANRSEERHFEAEKSEQELQNSVQEEIKDDSDLVTASEPISIGGAFLTCRYPEGQQQISDEFVLACQLNNVPPVVYENIEARFYKTDAAGQRYPLTIQEQNLSEWSWVLHDQAATVPLKMIELDLSFDGQDMIELSATVENTSLPIAVNTAFWLAGEPNNLFPNDVNGENCVEFRNTVGRNVHFQVTRLVSPPLGRFNDLPCRVSLPYLCRHSEPSNPMKWVMSSMTGPFNNYQGACPENYHFSLPMSEAEVLEVIEIVDSNPGIDVRVWVALHDQNVEGQFEYILP